MRAAIKAIFEPLLRHGHLVVYPPRGPSMKFGVAGERPTVVIRIKDPLMPLHLMMNVASALGESYMDGRLVIEHGTIYDFLELLAMNYRNAPKFWFEKADEFFAPVLQKLQQYNPMSRARRNVAHHYDLSHQLYEQFLDQDMQYSCAYFRNRTDSLENAQLQKKAHIAAKLMLEPGMRVLDIGCGWGGMALYLAQTADVEVTGLTLSEEQLKIATARAQKAGLAHRVKFYLRDYRQEIGQYDRIVSVGMFEHVGTSYYPEFFSKVHNLLTDDGIALLHSIGRMDGPGITNSWLRKYIFPGAYSPALSEVIPTIEKHKLWTTDIEILRLHYAETLRHWRMRFTQRRAAIAKLYDERFCRMWEFYLAGCEVHFRYLYLMVFQIQLAKNINTVPITRDYMFQEEAEMDDIYSYIPPAAANRN